MSAGFVLTRVETVAKHMNDVFEKHAKSGLLGEAAALRWLAEAERSGGLRVARVIEASDTRLVLERIREQSPTRELAQLAGAALAHTHAAGASSWGASPDGWNGAYVIAHSHTPCVPVDDPPKNWGSFFVHYRIRTYLDQLPRGFFSPEDLAGFDALCTHLEEGYFDVEQPALVGEGAARVHGDLWADNLLWSATSPTGAVLIDPMAHGGHAEEDLAMLALFGCAYLNDFMCAYNDVSPLENAWQERVALMQLAPLLHHCVLFGSSYRAQTLLALKHYV